MVHNVFIQISLNCTCGCAGLAKFTPRTQTHLELSLSSMIRDTHWSRFRILSPISPPSLSNVKHKSDISIWEYFSRTLFLSGTLKQHEFNQGVLKWSNQSVFGLSKIQSACPQTSRRIVEPKRTFAFRVTWVRYDATSVLRWTTHRSVYAFLFPVFP